MNSGQPVKSATGPAPPWWANPRLLLPITGSLGAATIVLGILFALAAGDDGSETTTNVVTCDTRTDPNCKLRTLTHLHANFALFIRGQQVDFNQPQFVSTEGNEKHATVHIHPERYGVVHVHLSQTTWDEFFTSLKFRLSDGTLGAEGGSVCLTLPSGEKLCNNATEKLRFVVNGVKVDGIANKVIGDLDRVLISYGAESDADLLAQYVKVGDDACISSERCKERIPPNEPKEQCQGGEGSQCVG